jgi:hypothetical protein
VSTVLVRNACISIVRYGDRLGYGFYLRGDCVGLTRVESDRHSLSDIVFGATLGIFTAHMDRNAHLRSTAVDVALRGEGDGA